ncbi:MAG: bifunctional diaminohydroxyphosphoribosylaminopyrimidine deaminase/5-amino-6-(5-phosphoribosylamino)uracil reductase RibD [Nitrospirae bacterium]|nr:bifunctional diaminohydroxyphosphoribosylaminopyrimidine deaminase/5-amino-6-(5-phosphoribosylamino)uracil reductase RibD [Magnetococcales bacterium]HAT48955.1 bifunctional diaminohydroxyphosphoribosylaminopyrimidine deaminase/5-amino-6-(5-phosphoribosylamino)uracil reductase RibD [Alphaproteobacteria bacterium]
MDLALRLAARGLGRTHPNPVVGCVLVKDGRVVGRGFHPRAGAAHAEVFALQQAGTLAHGATAYVTLEPCSHHGRTPPCADALIAAGVRRVVAAMTDPDPRVAGKGFARLKEAGIVIQVGMRETAAKRLNAPFISRVLRGRPLVHCKLAASLDGKTATHTGASQWITGPESRTSVGRLRNTHDVVMVGIGTLLADNPRLNCRIAGGRDPIRLVVDSRLRTPLEGAFWSSSESAPLWLATVLDENHDRAKVLRDRGANILVCRDNGSGRVDLDDLMQRLGSMGINSVLSEAGGELTGSLMAGGLVDRLSLYLAPMLIGGVLAPGLLGGSGVASLADALRLDGVEITRLGADLLIEATMGSFMQDGPCLPV